MKLIASLMVVVASFSLYQTSMAGVAYAPRKLLENLKIAEDIPEVTVQEENIMFDVDSLEEAILNKSPDTPPEVEEDWSQEWATSNECVINIRAGLTDPQPVFLVTDEAEFYPFSETGHMEIPAGQNLQMFCPGKFKPFEETLITATCVNGNAFRVLGSSYRFSELVCQTWPDFVLRKTGHDCEGGSLLQVGFEVSPTRFVEQMQICFNEEEEVTRYVHHSLSPGSNFYQTRVDRINFQTSGFFGGKNVDKLYSQKSQIATINNDLGGEGEKYFDSKNVFLARGHLGAKADLMFGSQQRATFLFVNAAPQWQVFNAGNWARIEDSLRTWVSKNKMHVECYTGVFGVTTLPDKEGHETPLYLARDANNNGLIPVPKLYFRLVIEPKTQKGIVFIGVNNPHLTLEQIQRDYILCQDISNQVNYIKWKKTNITMGYSYACEVADFVEVNENLPHLTAEGGLLL